MYSGSLVPQGNEPFSRRPGQCLRGGCAAGIGPITLFQPEPKGGGDGGGFWREELGLLGSTEFSRRHLDDLADPDQKVLVVNLDGIGAGPGSRSAARKSRGS